MKIINFFEETKPNKNFSRFNKDIISKVLLTFILVFFIIFDYINLSNEELKLKNKTVDFITTREMIIELEGAINILKENKVKNDNYENIIKYINNSNINFNSLFNIFENQNDIFNSNVVLSGAKYDNNNVELEIHSMNKNEIDKILNRLNNITENSNFIITNVEKSNGYSTFRLIDSWEVD